MRDVEKSDTLELLPVVPGLGAKEAEQTEEVLQLVHCAFAEKSVSHADSREEREEHVPSTVPVSPQRYTASILAHALLTLVSLLRIVCASSTTTR